MLSLPLYVSPQHCKASASPVRGSERGRWEQAQRLDRSWLAAFAASAELSIAPPTHGARRLAKVFGSRRPGKAQAPSRSRGRVGTLRH